MGPLADRGSAFGFVRWKAACQAAGIRPVYGVELGVSSGLAPGGKPKVDHWTFLARREVAPVNRLIARATAQFHYEPLLTYKQALGEPGVIALAGHRADWDAIARETAPGAAFLALSPACSAGHIRRARDHGAQFVAAGDNTHPREGDETLYQVIAGRNARTRTYPQHILAGDEWRAAMAHKGLEDRELDDAQSLAAALLAECTADLPTAEMLRPDRPATLRAMCEAGAARVGCDLSDPEYAARLDHELTVIEGKGFEDYFYVLAELQAYARSVMTCGPGRGSSAGSLVCWLLGITNVDPIKHRLLFERFLAVERNDWPDVDGDYEHTRRDLLFTHANQTYGAARVARLGSVGMFKANAAAEEVAKALDIPTWRFKAVAEGAEKHAAGAEAGKHALRDALAETDVGKALLREFPEAGIAARVENHPRHSTMHAAGLILTQNPVTDSVAVDHRAGVAQCDKYDAEALGLLKIDALGLVQLSVIGDCLRDLGLPHDHMDSVPLDDPAAYAVFNERRFSGVFQFTGPSLQGLARQVRFEGFEDIVALTSLARPGPIGSGGTARWVARKNGKAEVEYAHPLFESHLKDTLGVVTYQEQAMSIARDIGGMEWADVNAMRKAMGKSLGREAMAKFGDKWKAGALAKGIPADTVNRVWDELVENGQYLFNRSHSVAYAMVSYWCAWLKAHHPVQFAAASLQHEKDTDTQIVMLRELEREGIAFTAVHPVHSGDRWKAATVNGETRLMGPVQNVIGLGPKLVNAIMGARARGEPIPERCAKLLASGRTKLDSLWPIRDAFARLLPDPASAGILTPRSTVSDAVADASAGGEGREVVLFVRLDKMQRIDENEPKRVEKRGRRVEGPSDALNLQISDDTGTVFAKIHRKDFAELGQAILKRGGVGKMLYVVKGTMRGDNDFCMLWCTRARPIGAI